MCDDKGIFELPLEGYHSFDCLHLPACTFQSKARIFSQLRIDKKPKLRLLMTGLWLRRILSVSACELLKSTSNGEIC